jgi:hypothetical protein
VIYVSFVALVPWLLFSSILIFPSAFVKLARDT